MPSAYNSTVARVELRGVYQNEEVMNTLWFYSDTLPVTTGMLSDLASAVKAWWTANLKPVQSNQYGLREVYVAHWADAEALAYTLPVTPIETGANLNTGMPGNVALVVTFRSLGRGRSSRGRNYVVGMTENVVDTNYFSNAAVAAVLGAYEELSNALISTPWAHCVYSQFTDNALRSVGLINPVIGYTADNKVDSMRRRLPGRGR